MSLNGGWNDLGSIFVVFSVLFQVTFANQFCPSDSGMSVNHFPLEIPVARVTGASGVRICYCHIQKKKNFRSSVLVNKINFRSNTSYSPNITNVSVFLVANYNLKISESAVLRSTGNHDLKWSTEDLHNWKETEMEEEKESIISFYVLTATVVFLSYISLCYLRRRVLSRSPPLPPGPKGLPLLGSLPFLDPQLHSYFANLAEIYGPIFSIKLGLKLTVVVSSPSVAREILRDHDAVFANHDVPESGRVLTYGGANISWNPNGPTWRMLRKVAVREMLGGAPLDAMQELREKEVAATLRRIRDRVNQPVDVGVEMFVTVLNVITSKMWGGKVEEDDEFGEELKLLVGEMTELLGTPNVSDFFPILQRFDLQGVAARMSAIRERFDKLFEDVIRKKEINGDKGKDFVDVMLSLEREGSGGDSKVPFTRENLKGILLDVISGSTDTTSSTLEFAMAEIMNNPKILKKVQDEIDMVVGKDTIVQEAHISKLPYLNAIIKETLRLHSALPLLIPHCPSESCIINDYMVPKGARVFVNAWAIHRNPLVWEKPMEFRPERFLQVKGSDEGWDFRENEFRYIPFGSGRRICAGIGMAERVMPYLLGSLLHSFNWRMPGKELNVNEKFGIVLKKATPLIVVPTLRIR